MTIAAEAPARRGCFMTSGLYLKANGELPCWDDVGESRILRQLDPAALSAGQEANIADFAALRHIREAFAAGDLPHPGLCDRCAVRSAGVPTDTIGPSVLQVLHVEPSYMCHLSCPQCVPQRLRKSLKNPPYHLTPEMFDGFLSQLRSEGVRQIKLIIFEGRGDPLSAPAMETLLTIAKTHYPQANTCITTHGSFPYKPWIATSALDIIRFSIDGARQESYGRYRIGGKLDTVFSFMAQLRRDRPDRSRLYVEWKYLLFEWNDSDEELAEAAAIAAEHGVQLRFCRTHTPGRSPRYATAADVAAMIRRVAPDALQDLTFQLKDDADHADVSVVRDDQIRHLLVDATQRVADDEAAACAGAIEALALDGGIADLPSASDLDGLERIAIDGAAAITRAFVAEHMASLFVTAGRRGAAAAALERCAALTDDPLKRRHVSIEAAVNAALCARDRQDQEEVARPLARVLLPALEGQGLLALLGPALAAEHPGLAVALANLLEADGQGDAALLLYERYLALAPDASDRAKVARNVAGLRQARLIASARAEARQGSADYAAVLLHEAAALEPYVLHGQPAPLADLLTSAGSGLLAHVVALAVDAGDYRTAYLAEHRLREEGVASAA